MRDPSFEQLLKQFVDAKDAHERECAEANLIWAYHKVRKDCERAERRCDTLIDALFSVKDAINDALAG